MDEETQTKRGSNFGKLLWVLVLIAVVLLWWHFRNKPGDVDTLEQDDVAAEQIDRMALADTDPDDILVDLKDDITAGERAAIEAAAGITLALVDDTAEGSKLHRAHVDPSKRDAIIAILERNPNVEIAEPDSYMALSPMDMEPLTVASPEPSTRSVAVRTIRGAQPVVAPGDQRPQRAVAFLGVCAPAGAATGGSCSPGASPSSHSPSTCS